MKISVRAIISANDRIFLCQNKGNNENFWCLPGGHVEEGETLIDGIKRELFEEFDVIADVGKLQGIRELIDECNHYIEFYFHIKNGEDFYNIDLENASHGFEIKKCDFIEYTSIQQIELFPIKLKELLPELFINDFNLDIKYLGNVK